jgi:hypothetical protein
MNLYSSLGFGVRTAAAASLSARLSAWHDEMVAHERRLHRTGDGCDEECPHAQAPVLWSEAVAMFGTRANELRFLRAIAHGTPVRRGSRIAPHGGVERHILGREETDDGGNGRRDGHEERCRMPAEFDASAN